MKAGKVRLMGTDGFLQLLDVLGPALSKSGLGLTVSLLPLLRGSIDLGAELFSIGNTAWNVSLLARKQGDKRVQEGVGSKQDTTSYG